MFYLLIVRSRDQNVIGNVVFLCVAIRSSMTNDGD